MKMFEESSNMAKGTGGILCAFVKWKEKDDIQFKLFESLPNLLYIKLK